MSLGPAQIIFADVTLRQWPDHLCPWAFENRKVAWFHIQTSRKFYQIYKQKFLDFESLAFMLQHVIKSIKIDLVSLYSWHQLLILT